MTEASPDSNQPPGTSGPSIGSFVGRQREMNQLMAALDEALSGHGRLVMLAGEPGIGKTRTAEELAAYAEKQGFQVWWGRCYEGEGAPSYWPWVAAIRSIVREREPEQLRLEMGAGAADIAEVIPQLGEKLLTLEPLLALEPEQARFRLFDSIGTFLVNAAQAQPLMLVLDDLHWADRSTLLLLEFIAPVIGNSAIIIVGTYRDVEVSRRHPLSQTIGGLVRERQFLRVQLGGMTREETGQFIETTTSIRPSSALVGTVHARTEGNPLFVGEVIRTLTEEELSSGQYIANLPEGIRDAIGRRLRSLSEHCTQVLAIASVIGREFEFQLLGTLNDDLTEEQLLELLDEALEAGIIEELRGEGERYRFKHALIQQTLTGHLSISRRVRLNARIGAALEERYRKHPEVHVTELAHYFAEAEPVLGPEKLVHYSLRAGNQALAAYAWEEALLYFGQGLTARGVSLEGSDPANTGEIADLLFGLGCAKASTLDPHRIQEAVETLIRAFAFYTQARDFERALAWLNFRFMPCQGIVLERPS